MTVLVGNKRTKFMLHEQTLRSNSKFFEAALSRNWRESTERKVLLPEETTDHFRIYAQWVYTGKLFTEDKAQDMKPNQYPFDNLAGLYAMGARLQDQPFQDAAIDAILAETRVQRGSKSYLPAPDLIPIIYENTLPGDAARRLLVDICVKNNFKSHIRPDKGEPYLQFAADVASVALSDQARKGDIKLFGDDGSTCKYHGHGSEGVCYSKTLKDGVWWA